MQTNLERRRVEIQQQSSLVDALRRRIYAGVEISTSDELWDELNHAEIKLLQLLNDRRKLEGSSSEGTILETSRDVSGVELMGRDTTGLDVRVQLRMERIPTGIVHILDSSDHPLLTYEIENTSSTIQRLRLISYVEGYSASTVNTVEIPRRGTVEISQLPTFFPDRIESITELSRATLHMQVDDLDGTQELHNTQPIWLLARNSAYLSVKDPTTGNLIDLSRYLAAWVTPHTEDIMQILRTAADHHPESLIAGYQGNAEFVESQVEAIYEALQNQGIKYINSTICFGQGQGEYMQRIRLPGESLKTRSANCIDGTVLFASLLEAASINPGIVLVPGHALLGWQSQREGEWDYLETTMVSTSSFDAAQEVGRNLAQKYQDTFKTTQQESFFRRLSLAEMRSEYRVTPLE